MSSSPTKSTREGEPLARAPSVAQSRPGSAPAGSRRRRIELDGAGVRARRPQEADRAAANDRGGAALRARRARLSGALRTPGCAGFGGTVGGTADGRILGGGGRRVRFALDHSARRFAAITSTYRVAFCLTTTTDSEETSWHCNRPPSRASPERALPGRPAGPPLSACCAVDRLARSSTAVWSTTAAAPARCQAWAAWSAAAPAAAP